MTATESVPTTASATPGQSARPQPPRPSGTVYLGLLALTVAAYVFFWVTRESTAVLFLPLGGLTLWVPQWPTVGVLIMLAVLALCWRTRTGEMAAFGAQAFIIFTYWAGSQISFDLLRIYDRWSNLEGRIQEFLNPNWAFLWNRKEVWLDTFFMAVVATVLGCLIGLILAMLASPVSSPNKYVSQTVKALNSVIRSIPDVGWALLFLAFIATTTDQGVLAGILALLMFNIGIIAKLVGESIDNVGLGPIEAVDASGANLIQRDRIAVFPQIIPSFISYGLYVFELNIRASAALGIVGIAGVGQLISLANSRRDWDNMAAILAALIVVVLLVDLLSMWIRRRLL